jgi:hypothetical protein
LIHFEKHAPVPKSAHFELPDALGYGIELDDGESGFAPEDALGLNPLRLVGPPRAPRKTF